MKPGEQTQDYRVSHLGPGSFSDGYEQLLSPAPTTSVSGDMGGLYDSAHATMLPGLDFTSFKPAPHSALESLGRGKPLLVTPTSSIADLVTQWHCGLVCEPTIAGFEAAVRSLMARYGEFQENCQRAVEACFSQETFIAKYRLLYEELLQSSTAQAAASPVRQRGWAGRP